MSDLYVITSSEPRASTVTLEVRVCHPDAPILRYPDDRKSKSFALMLLQESAPPGAPLATRLSYAEVSDKAWVRAHAAGFIDAVEVVSLQNEPPEEALADEDHAYWSDDDEEREPMRVSIKVTATHPAWVQHLQAGREWDSAAFSATNELSLCAPITPA